jgi:small nuclear ribonucleoprotein (snRNP)-like protein
VSDEEAPFIRITNREIWDTLQHLDNTVQSMDQRMNAILNENVEIKSRVRALELKTYTMLAGFSTALIGGVAILVKGVIG